MTKSDKIRAYFCKHPDADVTKVAAKFEAPKPMTYKLRKQVLDGMFQAPEMVPMPEPKTGRKVILSSAQLAIAGKLGISPQEFVKGGLEAGVLQYEDELEKGTDVDETLDERAKDYGKFIEGAEIMQMLKRIVHNYIEARGTKLAFDQREAIDMIIHKLGRIINGNPDKVDHWVDIAGYSKLVADRLEGVER